ncbi:MAG: hypothetical protein PHP44_11955 [Kiritimatiellae bacterium]|nr:hypothetical protein [Kiritimatiellia bacterium]
MKKDATPEPTPADHSAPPADCVEIIREESAFPRTPVKRSRFFFWRNPSKRERQIAALQEGYAEMITLMRAIRGHLEMQSGNQKILFDHLPDAIEGIKNMGSHADRQTHILELMQHQSETSLQYGKDMASSLDRFNSTLTTMDHTNRQTTHIITDLAERTEEAEDLVRTMLIRSQHRLIIMAVVLLLTTLAVSAAAVYLLLQ